MQSILFKNKKIRYTNLFEMFIGQVTQKLHPNYRDELIKILADCLVTEPLCFTIWSSIYTKHLYQSNLLLTYIGEYTFSFLFEIFYIFIQHCCYRYALSYFKNKAKS